MTDQELREYIKERHTNGATITEIIHPYSQLASLTSLDITNTNFLALSAADKLIAAQKATFFQRDTDYENRVLTIFNVANSLLLDAAITDYNSVPTGNDIIEKEKQINLLNYDLCQLLTEAQIVASYPRTSTVVGAPNLEDMLSFSGISFESTHTDTELAQKILGTF